MRLRQARLVLVVLLVLCGFVGHDGLRVSPILAETHASGIIDQDTTWSEDGNPYLIRGNLVVEDGATLTIEPGVMVKFAGFYSFYVENGSLVVTGSSDERVLFTSNNTVKKSSDWRGIRINSTGLGRFEYCDLEYAQQAILSYSPLTIINCTVSESGIGVALHSEASVISNSTFTSNGIGIDLGWATNNTISGNRFFSNSDAAISMDWFSSQNVVHENLFSDGRIGIQVLRWSESNDVMLNRISNNDFGIWIDESSLNNQVSNNSILGNARLAIHSDAPTLVARGNYFGVLNESRIGKMVENVDCSDFLIKDPVNRTLKFIGDETWAGNVTVSEPIIVNGTLEISNATVLFEQSDGENFIQVNGNMTIRDSLVKSSSGSFTILYVNNSGGHISGSRFLRQRSLTTYTVGLSIVQNDFSEGHMAIVVGPDSSSVNIMGNHFKFNSATDVGSSIPYGIMFLSSSRDIAVLDNVVSFNNGTGIHVWDSDRITIVNNTIASNFFNANGIRLAHSRSTTVSRNRILLNGWAGIRIAPSSQFIDISQNIIYENWWGILGSLEFSVLWDNALYENYQGIVLHSSNDNTLLRNEIHSNDADGIALGDSDNETIVGNIIHANGRHGMDLRTAGCLVRGNEIHSNAGSGIYLSRQYNTITSNNISSNLNGIHLFYEFPFATINNTLITNNLQHNVDKGILLNNASDTLIYHNNIIQNGVQASDNGNTNDWDNGYPSGGNYWSDYSGVDDFSGPNQDQPGSDGIGDTVYAINPTVRDHYPLMNTSTHVFPSPPEVAFAHLSGPLYGNVTIGWNLSKDDGQGDSSVVGYHIYRNDSSYDSRGRGYQLIATVPNGTSAYSDEDAGEGDPMNYFYRVCAFDALGGASCGSNQAGKYTRFLQKGNNLVSIPLIQHNRSTEVVFQTLGFDEAWVYDVSETGTWMSYMTQKPYKGSLQEVSHVLGVWVSTVQDSNLTVAGIVPRLTVVNLKTGWNLIGFPSMSSSYSVSQMKNEIGSDDLEGYAPLSPPYHLQKLENEDVLRVGYGYWVKVWSDTSLTFVN